MLLAFNIALHVLLVGSLIGFLAWLVWSTITERDNRERLMRILALFCGALVALGAQATGLNYAQFAVEALAGARPASAVANVGATVVPALLGAGLGFLVTRKWTESERMANRLVGLIGMLAAVAFLETYAQAASVNGVFLGKASIPNISFIAGIILTVVLIDNPDQPRNSKGMLASLWSAVGLGGKGVSSEDQVGARHFTRPQRRDPFSS
jgi:hypothetical protein